MINDRPAGALTGFKWNQGDNPHGIPTAQQFCFRDAMETNDVAAASVLRAYVGSTWSRPDIVAIMAGEWDDA
jgi:hypothetical protein